METSQRLKNLENIIKEKVERGEFDSREERLFDTAYKAVNSKECLYVSENTSSRTLQDYAILKANFFADKGF